MKKEKKILTNNKNITENKNIHIGKGKHAFEIFAGKNVDNLIKLYSATVKRYDTEENDLSALTMDGFIFSVIYDKTTKQFQFDKSEPFKYRTGKPYVKKTGSREMEPRLSKTIAENEMELFNLICGHVINFLNKTCLDIIETTEYRGKPIESILIDVNAFINDSNDDYCLHMNYSTFKKIIEFKNVRINNYNMGINPRVNFVNKCNEKNKDDKTKFTAVEYVRGRHKEKRDENLYRRAYEDAVNRPIPFPFVYNDNRDCIVYVPSMFDNIKNIYELLKTVDNIPTNMANISTCNNIYKRYTGTKKPKNVEIVKGLHTKEELDSIIIYIATQLFNDVFLRTTASTFLGDIKGKADQTIKIRLNNKRITISIETLNFHLPTFYVHIMRQDGERKGPDADMITNPVNYSKNIVKDKQ